MKETKRIPPGFMILKGEELERELNDQGKTVRDFANALDIEMIEAYGILSGEKEGIDIARRFVKHYGADFAHGYIDWKAMAMTDPYCGSKKRNVKTRHYDRRRII
ncbi:hypothetical protein FACS1894211_00970 [Clostridia bacterium]|nr:hypothetical protein FACS1894211_00970 [Clostridia bacterium]